MKILNAELVTSASVRGPRDGLLRDDVAQFAFAGRSNVGKSSLLNALMRQRLARTSAAAGKTRQANIFHITAEGGLGHPGAWHVYLVDLPGYGYARGGHDSANELGEVVRAYFAASQQSAVRPGFSDPKAGGVFLLVDSRHPGLKADLQAHRWLSESIVHPVVVATKIDKLSRSERTTNLKAFEKLFNATPIGVSVTSGEGLDEVWRIMARPERGNSGGGTRDVQSNS